MNSPVEYIGYEEIIITAKPVLDIAEFSYIELPARFIDHNGTIWNANGTLCEDQELDL